MVACKANRISACIDETATVPSMALPDITEAVISRVASKYLS